MYDSEKPLTRRARLFIFVALWLVGIPFFIALYLLMSWVALLILAGAIWASLDWLRKGDFFSVVDRGFTAESRMVDGLSSNRRRRDR